MGSREQMAQLVELGGDPEDDASEFGDSGFAAQEDGEHEDEDAEDETSEALEDRRLLLSGLRSGEEHLLIHVGDFTIEVGLNDDEEAYTLSLSGESMSDDETEALAPHLGALGEQEALEDMLIVAAPASWEEGHAAEKRLLLLIGEARAAAGME